MKSGSFALLALITALIATAVCLIAIAAQGISNGGVTNYRKVIRTGTQISNAPFSPGIQVNNTLYLSGALGRMANGKLAPGGIVGETNQAMKNIGELLKVSGAHFKNIIKITILLANISDYSAMNKAYKLYFQPPYPARSAYQVGALPSGALVEIEAIAVVGNLIEDN